MKSEKKPPEIPVTPEPVIIPGKEMPSPELPEENPGNIPPEKQETSPPEITPEKK